MNWGFHPAAEAEHLEQVAFYHSRRAGLGMRYVADLESTLERVCDNPQRYRIERAPDIRRAALRQFPFTLIFREAGGLIQVLAVAHYRRRPHYWIARL